MQYHIKNIKLAPEGKRRTEFAGMQMNVLQLIKEKFAKEKPLKNLKIGCCLHVTSETANLMLTLKDSGAKISLCASNPLSTQDEVASYLVKEGISVFAINGEDSKTYYEHLNKVLDNSPNITMDDGGDLVSTVHKERKNLIENIIAGTEETTTGVNRFRVMEKDKVLKYPIIAVNDANTKHLFDNVYGTGQSTIDGVLRATNVLLAGKNFVVCGYGYCGRGISFRARGLGSNVIVCEVNPLKALQSVMDGFRVMDLKSASKIGDIFITATGNKNVLTEKHFKLMKNNVILANAGHFNVEICIPDLEKLSIEKREIRKNVMEYNLKNKKLYLLGEGRLINLTAGEGHPPSVMDMSFSLQALCSEFIKKEGKNLQCKVYDVPKEIDEKVGFLKLKTMGIKIDKLTKEQKKYLQSWEEGT